jgi:hypothetical protein
MVVKYFSGAECGIDHCVVVAEVRVKLPLHKQSVPIFVVKQFNMKRLIEDNVREDYQLKITNRFAALEYLKVGCMEISKAWENIRDSKRWKITGRR